VLIYLSTNIIPKQRKERIQQIKSLTKNGEKRVIVVSTQMIEAGVDIDLDIGFRDIGPIDSVVQILGRLNRNASKDQGILYLFQLSDEDSQKEKLFWEYIYDPLVRNISSHILNKYTQIEESSYKELFDEYFRYIKERQSKDTSQLIRQARNKADFLTVHEKFKLIENTETVDIFVELDAKAKSLWETKENLRKTIPNKWERKQLWDTQYKKDF
jgi:CRISPR-associated endonuclease/helicase Cas3